MANANNMDMNIDVQTNGVDQSIKAFDNLTKSISRLVSQLDKLSNKLSAISGKVAKVFTPQKQPILKQQNNYSKGYLELAKSGVLGELGSFLLADTNEIQRAILKQNKNLDKAYLLAGGSTKRKIKKFTSTYEGTSFQLFTSEPQYTNVYEKVTKELRGFNKELNNSGKESKSASQRLLDLSKSIAKITRTIYTATRVANAISSLVKESGTWIENLNLFAVTFGENDYRDMLNWATEYADKLGMANNEIVRMTGYFKQLSTAIGITSDQGTKLSQILTQLGYDFASFYNINTSTAFEYLQSGIFSGQIRTLRNIGIDISQAAIQNLLDTSTALQGMGASAIQLTQTQKVLARLILTMQAGTNAFGDMARSIDTLQNRQRVFTASLQNLRLALGDALAEPARELFAYGIAIVQVITDIVRALIPLQTELSYDIGDTVFTEITDEAEEAESAINQLPFDKFTSLTTGDEEQVNLTEALNSMLEEQIALYQQVSSQFDGIDERVQEIRNNILQWVFPDKTIEQIQQIFNTDGAVDFNSLLEQMNPTIRSILKTLETLWGVVEQFAGLISQISPELSKAVSTILQIVSGIVKLLDDLNLLYPLLLSIIALKIYNKLKKLTGLSFSGIISNITKLTNTFKTANTSMQLLGSYPKSMLTEGAKSFKDYFTKINTDGTKTFNSLRAGATLVTSAMAGFMAYSLADSFFGQFQKEGAFIIGLLGTLAAAIVGVTVAAMAMAGALSWGAAIPAIVAAIGVGIAGVQSMIRGANEMKGYATGGIPDKSELFYMNEHGIPEALINTGGAETNVINQQQLKTMVRDGFIEAMSISGSNEVTIRIEGNDINNSAFARAIFPAMKAESRRRGGNQL